MRAYAQAEAAPDGYRPPEGVPMTEDPRVTEAKHEARRRLWLVEVQPRLVIPLGNPADLPWVGFGFGVGLSRGLLVMGRARLGLGLSFAYERLQHDVDVPPTYDRSSTTQALAHASFSLDLRLEGFVASGRVRPWAALGPAMSVATYSDPRFKLDNEVSVLPALRAGLGCAVEIASGVEVGGRVEWLATFRGNEVGTPPVNPYKPGTFSVGLDVGFRF